MWLRALALAGAAACSPYGGGAFRCAADGECSSATVQGVCEASGFCSFADPGCGSGRRYGSTAGTLAGQCVGGDPADAAADSSSGGADAAGDGRAADADAVDFCGAAGVVACWRFEGNLLDDSGNGNDATPTTETFVGGVNGMAMQTYAATEADVPESASLDVTALTIEMWINPDVLPSAGRAMLFDNNGQYGFWLDPGGVLRCAAGGSASGPTVVSGAWTHVACTADGVTTSVWMNGVESTAVAGAPLSTAGIDGSSIAANVPSGETFLGRLDDVRIFGVVHTPTP